MATRQDLYEKFGPLLLEAVVLLVLDELNLLRQRAGLPPRTAQQLLDSLDDRLSELPEYPWMRKEA